MISLLLFWSRITFRSLLKKIICLFPFGLFRFYFRYLTSSFKILVTMMTLICLIMVYLFIFLTWGPVSLRLTTGLGMGKNKLLCSCNMLFLGVSRGFLVWKIKEEANWLLLLAFLLCCVNQRAREAGQRFTNREKLKKLKKLRLRLLRRSQGIIVSLFFFRLRD